MAKKIIFIPHPNKDITMHAPPPLPAKLFLPEWYRTSEMFIDSETGLTASKEDRHISGGLKSCVPFMDALLSGYMMHTWKDVEITRNDGVVEWKYLRKNEYTNELEHYDEATIPLLGEREGDIGHQIPRPAGHSQNHLVFKGGWGMKLPRGWSLMVIHPMNRFDLPFTTMSAIMDSDSFSASGNIPFFIKENWTGVIPRGTPFAQLIPIKRKTWHSHVDSGLHNVWANEVGNRARSVPHGYYKKNVWVRKKYE